MAGCTLMSFFLDDVGPYSSAGTGDGGRPLPVDAGALLDLLGYVRDAGIAGAVSVIPALYGLLSRPKDEHERRFAAAVGRLAEYPVDAHMEIMTHDRLFDFAAMATRPDGPTEMEWLDDLSVSTAECREYFANTIAAGRELGVRYAGFTTPGTHPQMNPNVWQALLDLAAQGEFAGPNVAVFANVEPEPAVSSPRLMASQGPHRVYDVPSATDDFLACWLNSPERLDADYYLNEDGKGRLPALIEAGSPIAVMHMHWQGVNPQHGLGWQPLQQVIARVTDRYGDRVTWLRPSELVASLP